MKRRISSVAVLAMFSVFLVPASVAASPARATKVSVDLHQHPTGGKTPVEVSVGLYVTNLVAIDETRETFEVGGYLIGVWQDPRLALPVGRPFGASRFRRRQRDNSSNLSGGGCLDSSY
jgi:hypothetical protein